MKFIPNAVVRKAADTALTLKSSSPKTLFIVGVAGVGVTIALTIRATLKLEGIVDEHEMRMENLKRPWPDVHTAKSRKDVVWVYTKTTMDIAKLYAPAFLVASASICALAGSHNMLSKRNTAMTAAYAAVDQAFGQYRERVVEELGDDKDREFRYGVEACEIDQFDKNGAKTGTKSEKRVSSTPPSGFAMFFDRTSHRWVGENSYNEMMLKNEQNYMNDILHQRGHVLLNDVYDRLGLKRTAIGAQFGWLKDSKTGDGYVDFGCFDDKTGELKDFVHGIEGDILLDFNVDRLPIFEQI